MKTIADKRSKLRSLNGVLDNWIKANTFIAKSWKADGDVPWWYNERASLGLLAGSAFKADGIAFEEITADKRKTSARRRKSKPYLGRTDIYLKIGNHEFIGEAKQCWSGATAMSSNPIISIEKNLSAACSDVRQTKAFGQRRLGILFAIPYIKKSSRNKMDERIEGWIEWIQNVDCSCCAWVFPADSRHAEFTRRDENLYPGIALLIRKV
jgi:hypothetical protein